MNLDELRERLQTELDAGTVPSLGKLVDGRLVAVLGSPELGSSSDLAFGVSIVPAGLQTEEHAHRAEEVALVLSGNGELVIDGGVVALAPGDLVRTPPNARHRTRCLEGSSLQILWIYAPVGSEHRWLAAEDVD